MKQVNSITQAIRSAGLTPTGLTDLLLQVDQEASASTKARITVILDGLCNLTLTDGGKLLKETAKAAKGQPTEKTVKVRVSECYQLFGAVKLFDGFRAMIENKNLGWSPAVSAARLQLAEKHLKANGDHAPTKEEKAEAQAKANTLAILAENMVGDASDEVALAEAAQRTAERLATVGASEKAVKTHAGRIIKQYGMDYAVAVSDEIVARYNAALEADAKADEQYEAEKVAQAA